MPKWIERWVKRWESKFPECAIRCKMNADYHGYLLEAYYPEQTAWHSVMGVNWYYWAIALSPSPSPAVWQNRRKFRQEADYSLRQGIDGVKALSTPYQSNL